MDFQVGQKVIYPNHGEGGRIHVHEDRARAAQENGLARADEREGHGDDLAAGSDAPGPQGQGQGVGAVRDAAGMSTTTAVLRARKTGLSATRPSYRKLTDERPTFSTTTETSTLSP